MAGALTPPNREPAVGMAEALRQRRRALLGLSVDLKSPRDNFARGMPGREPWDIPQNGPPLAPGQNNQAAETYRALQEPTPNLDVMGISAVPGQTAPAVQNGLVVEPELVKGIKDASPEAKARAGAAMQAKGVDVEAVYKAAYDAAPEQSGFDLRSAIEGYREKYKPKGDAELTKEEKSMLLLELGMRMMAAAGQPGASNAGAIGQAGMGTLGTMRGLQRQKKEDLVAEEERGERRALGEANIDLQQRALDDRALDRRTAAGNSAVDRALEQQRATLDAQGPPQYMTDDAGVVNRVFRDGPARAIPTESGEPFKGQRLGGAQSPWDRKYKTALAAGWGENEALAYANGFKQPSMLDYRKFAQRELEADAKTNFSRASFDEKKQMVETRAAQLQAEDSQGASAQSQGAPLTAPQGGGAVSAQLPPQAVDAVRNAAGKPVKFKNGQVWQWQNGQPTQVQ